MAASFEVAGVRVDTGSHRLHPATPAPVLSLLRGLLGGDLQTRRRNGRLRVYDRWVDFPLRPVELARTLPPAALLRIGRDAATRPVTRPDPTSYASLLVSTLGPELYNALYGPYAEKLWGLPGRDIDAEQARRRVSTGGVWGIARTLVRLDRSRQGRVFYYPRRGFGQIADVLAEAAAAAGAAVETGAEVTAVEPEPDGVTVSTADGRTVRAGHVFSTVPLPVLARLAGGPVPPTGLAFRAMVLVYLVHTGGRWTGHDAHYLPGPQTRVTRLSEPANYRASRDDPADRSVLCAEIPCAVGDPVWTSTPDDLAELVRDGLRASGLPAVQFGGVEVRRLPHVYPVYEIGYADRLRPLDEWVDGLDRVTTFGRLGLFAHDNSHHAMAEALDAVAALRPDGTRDPGRWAAARARFAAHVVED
jgi:protoporphyrinogen oxidase